MLEIPVRGGRMGGYLAGATGRRPGILVLQEIFGVNIAMRSVADTLAAAGYLVFAPDLFHRLETGVALSYEPEDRPKALALWERYDADLTGALADIAAAIDVVRLHQNCNGRVGLVGFCLGGKLALLAASDGGAQAAVAYYPVQMQRHRAEVRRIECPIQVQLGSDDSHVPPEVMSQLAADVALTPQGQLVVHEGAGHGFYNSYRAVGYHPAAAAAAHAGMMQFLHDSLGGAASGD